MIVSIITPTFNSAKYFSECAESVIHQSYSNWEWIVIDDCSIDGTMQIIERYLRMDSRIKVLRTSVNSGSGYARNLGIEAAAGKYITFLDSDDIWVKDRLQTHVGYMEMKASVFSHTSYGYIDEHSNKYEKVYSVSSHSVGYRDLLKRTEISCLTAMYNQKIVGKVLMPNIRRKQDYGLWLKILKMGHHSDPLDVVTGYYRQHDESATSSKFKLILFHLKFLRQHERLNWFFVFYYTICWGVGGFKKYFA